MKSSAAAAASTITSASSAPRSAACASHESSTDGCVSNHHHRAPEPPSSACACSSSVAEQQDVEALNGIPSLPTTAHTTVTRTASRSRSSEESLVPGAYAQVGRPVAHRPRPSWRAASVSSTTTTNGIDMDGSMSEETQTVTVRAELAPNYEEIMAERDALRAKMGSILEAKTVVKEAPPLLWQSRRCVLLVVLLLAILVVIVAVAVGFSLLSSSSSSAQEPSSNSTEQDMFWTSRQVGQTLLGEGIYDRYGETLALSYNGTRLAVGADKYGKEFVGKVLLYQLEPNSRTWQLWTQILGDSTREEAGQVALAGDGTKWAIGAPKSSTTEGEQVGRVKTFQLDATTTTTPPLQMGQTLEGRHAHQNLGGNVQLSANGTILAVGATRTRDSSASQMEVGSVQVFQYTPAANQWNQLGQELKGSTEVEYFGSSVALSDEGTVLAIGGYGYGNSSGIVRIYKLEQLDSTWKQLGQAFQGEAANDELGRSISLSSNGSILAFAGHRHNNSRGRVYVYKWDHSSSDGTWTPMGQTLNGIQEGDGFGSSIALSGDGTVLAAATSSSRDHVGHVRVFHWNSTTFQWDKVGPPIRGSNGDWLVRMIAMSKDGTTLAIGGPFHDSVDGRRASKVEVYSLP